MAWELIDNIRGPKGDKGDPGSISSASIATLPAGSAATVAVTGGTEKHVAFGVPKGDKGDQGVPGTLSSASAETVPSGEPAEVIMSGTTEVKHAHFRIPRGMPGSNAIENDAAVAAYVEGADTATRTALKVATDVDAAAAVSDPASAVRAPLDALYPVRLLWDPVTETYPDRVPGAVNFFLGGPYPGLAMDPAVDYWVNPDGATIDEIIAEIQDVSSPLRAAVKTATTPEVVEFSAMDLAPVDNRPPTLGTLSGAANLAMGVPVMLFADNLVQVAGAPWRTPVGWSAARVYIDWGHNVSPVGTPSVSWQARLVGYGHGTDLSVTPGLQTLAQVDSAPPAVKTVKRFLIAGNFTLDPAGAEVRIAISRLSTAFGGPVGLIKLIMERTA